MAMFRCSKCGGDNFRFLEAGLFSAIFYVDNVDDDAEKIEVSEAVTDYSTDNSHFECWTCGEYLDEGPFEDFEIEVVKVELS